MSPKRILIMAGGTGGHVYPALAVAESLRANDVQILWLGTESGLEARVVPEKGYNLSTIRVAGLRGKNLLRILLAPLTIAVALFQSMKIIRQFKPDAVLGMGGYVSGPGGIAAWILRVPLYIHEQNAIAGLTNRLLAPLATYVMQGFPDTFKSTKHLQTTGNPVREEILSLASSAKLNSEESKDDICLLVLGGSLGARALNQTVPAAMKVLDSDSRIQIWHQTGPKHLQQTKENYERYGLKGARVDAYIEDMADAYEWADLVLCRAGALTLAELCVVGLASVLIPFPYAVDDHQTANAKHLSDAGAAVLLPESELDAGKLASLLGGLCHARTRLRTMAESTRKLAYLNATTEVAEICLGGAHA
jgi:UDP-N-acetylglucosamine--N-acetylmuramyl-(pentapeptide) pyrophosphoryl-undecaprenol N-acetylglucosamine transferase